MAEFTFLPDFLDDADAAFTQIMSECEFTQRETRAYGRTVRVPRLEAWYGEHDYRFAGHTFPARALPPILAALRVRVEAYVPAVFRGALVNLYRDGGDSVAWHSDDEPEMGDDVVVASISLGASRDFLVRRKRATPAIASAVAPNRRTFTLTHGSLLVMAAGVQADYEHALPKRARVSEPRINVTFRGRPL